MEKWFHLRSKIMPRKNKNNNFMWVNGDPVEKIIAQYITVDGENLSNIRVDLDNLTLYLLSQDDIYFSGAKFGRMLKQEMEQKLLGKPFTEASMTALCTYINELSKYLTQDHYNAQYERTERISRRRRNK